MSREAMLTVQQVADQLGVHPDTVRQWIRTGELYAIDLGGRAGYRVPESSIADFISKRGTRPKDSQS
jgi:excisionase family DNA binding protein